MTLMTDPCHTWNAIYNARSNKCHCPNTKYWACHEKWISWLILVTHETLFTMRGVTTVIVQTHQILRLPRKMNLMIDPCHTWNAIYNARSNKCHCPNSPNTAPATQSNTHHRSLSHMKRYLQCAEQQVSLSKLTKYCACHAKWLSWYCHDWSSSHMKRYLQCAEQQVASSNITKYCACHAKWFSKISETFLQNRWNVNSNARPIRDRSENDPSMIRPWSEHETVTPQPASQPRLLFTPTTSILYWKIQHFALRLSFQISPNTAPATKSDTSTSPNTAPATKNESHDWSLSHMKRYLQCAEQQVSLSKLTKYCACHEKWISWLILVTHETLFTMRGTTGGILQHHQILRLPRKMTVMTDPRHIWNAIYNARNNRWHPPTSPNTAPATQNDSPKFHKHFSKTDETSITMRDRSELDPSRIRAGNRHPQPASQPRLLFRTTTSILYWKIQHFALRLSFQISPNTAPATKSDTSTSPNTAPATQNDCHNWSSSHVKRYFQCAEQPVSSWNISEYCVCHAKWLSNISKKFLENSWNVISNAGPIRAGSELDPRMIRAENRHPQPASQPRLLFRTTTSILYWKIQHFALRLSFQISPNTAPATKSDTSTSPNTAPATKSDTWTSPNTAPATKSDTWTSPNSAPATKSDTWTPPNSAPATKSHTTLLYSSLVFATILLRIFSNESLLKRI